MAKRKRGSPAEVAPSKASRTTTRKTTRTSKPAVPTRITRSMTTDAARQAVLNTAELLENVLVHLPPRKLFTLQRVSRQFKAAIEDSVQMQKKMFLRLGGEPEEEWIVDANAGPYYKGIPGIYSVHQVLPASSQISVAGSGPSFHVARSSETILLASENLEMTLLSKTQTLGIPSTMHDSAMSLTKGERHSWENVYLCDPPCTDATLYLWTEFGRGPSELTLHLRATGTSALTMGSLMQNCRVEKVDCRSHLPYFGPSVVEPWVEKKLGLQECLAEVRRELGGKRLVLKCSLVLLPGFVVPTDEQRRQVEANKKSQED